MKTSRAPGRGGFTLVEMLVSMALVCVMAVLLVTTTNSASSLWRYTNNRIEEFRGARTAFEEITRNLSQATLNTYWDYDKPQAPTKYQRQSELRFLSAPSEAELFKSTQPRRPTHGVFFQSPLGLVDDSEHFSALENLLNTWGYYVEFNKDVRPPLIDNLQNGPPSRYRYRLMELMEPSNELTLYKYTSGKPAYNGHEWFNEPITGYPAQGGAATLQPVHVLAENVIALVILPKLAKAEDATGLNLAPLYKYDSTQTTVPADLNSFNQLPPVVQVTLVAIDEASANRVANHTSPATVPEYDTLLKITADGSAVPFTVAKNFDADLKGLQDGLAARHLGFRVFTSDVSIRGARWSRK